MSFDAGTGTLSFSDAEIDFANLVGDESLDPIFWGDPILGATISVTDFVLSGALGSGFLFTGGTMTISSGSTTFLAADIPELLIDDGGLLPFGLNWWGPLEFTDIASDFGESLWLESYWTTLVDSDMFFSELMGQTEIPVTGLIQSETSFEVETLETLSITMSIPEPSTIILFAVGILGVVGIRYRQRKKPS